MILRALLVWLLLAVIAVSAGAAREGLLTPAIGSEAAHVTGTSRLWLVGGLWFVLTVAFEFGFGRWVAGHSWSALLRDYDVFAGRVWILVLLTVLLAPVWLGRLRAGHPG